MGQIESLGLSYESYRKSYTSTLLTHLFGSRVTASDLTAHLTEGKYIRSNDYKAISLFPKSDADDEWWIPSGKMSFPVNPELHFFLPEKYIDPFGSITTVNYYSDYHLLINKTTDSIGNTISVEVFDWRLPAAQLIKDLNDNYAEGRFDILGFLVGTAIKGKGNEADDFANFKTDLTDPEITAFFKDPVANSANLLQHATSRFIYDFSVTPVRVAGIARETHHQLTLLNKTPSKLQLSFEYSDGLGHVAMKKMQAEPGFAKELDSGNNVIEVDTSPSLRWVGNGRAVLNNKGKPVKQYEPYFSVKHEYEDDKQLVEIGVTPVLYYDPVGRLIKTDFPDGTFAKTEFDAWQQLIYDPNDTVNDSDWYALRTTGSLSSNPQENQAAQKASVHYNTPGQIYLDSLGRSFYTIAHNRFEDHKTSLIVDEFYSTQSVLDIESNQRQVIDARKNQVMEYAYDMLGTKVYQKSMDAGDRWLLTDCMGKPMYTWDSKDQQFHTTYDAIHRPLQSRLKKGVQQEIIFAETIFGEGQSNNKILNLRGQPYRNFDQAGIITRVKFDFKGNLLESNRVFTVDYDKNIDWSASPVMQSEIFTSQSEYDALNRTTKLTAPNNNISTANILVPGYNEAGLLETMEVFLRGSSTKSSFVKNIDHNEKGQRTHIQYGNNVVTNYTYDPLTFRLNRLITTRNAGADILQDLNYTFDPVGNITLIRDDAQDTIYFKNKKVDPDNDYTYDAVYRLTEALGREHIGQQYTPDAYDDFRMNNPQPGDGNQMQTYKQQFTYDEAGNMLQMQNVNSWNRLFAYSTNNNQLLTAQPSNPVTSPFTYTYDPHGNILAMPHLAKMDWNFKDELQHIVITPLTANNNSQQSWYVYDAGGQRVRKIVLKDNVTEERIYLGGIELFRRTRNNALELERETLHVMDDKQIIALVDTPVLVPNNSKETQLIRYQFSNHLGTACLELDDGKMGTAIPQIISYEEYYPYGSTSYSAVDKTREVPSKRYRYTGKERDEESGLYYHGARYYAPWLARWISSDPSGIADGNNRYAYVHGNPVKLRDPNGKQSKPIPVKWPNGNTIDIGQVDWNKTPGGATIDSTSPGSTGLTFFHDRGKVRVLPEPATTLADDPVLKDLAKEAQEVTKPGDYDAFRDVLNKKIKDKLTQEGANAIKDTFELREGKILFKSGSYAGQQLNYAHIVGQKITENVGANAALKTDLQNLQPVGQQFHLRGSEGNFGHPDEWNSKYGQNYSPDTKTQIQSAGTESAIEQAKPKQPPKVTAVEATSAGAVTKEVLSAATEILYMGAMGKNELLAGKAAFELLTLRLAMQLAKAGLNKVLTNPVVIRMMVEALRAAAPTIEATIAAIGSIGAFLVELGSRLTNPFIFFPKFLPPELRPGGSSEGA